MINKLSSAELSVQDDRAGLGHDAGGRPARQDPALRGAALREPEGVPPRHEAAPHLRQHGLRRVRQVRRQGRVPGEQIIIR